MKMKETQSLQNLMKEARVLEVGAIIREEALTKL